MFNSNGYKVKRLDLAEKARSYQTLGCKERVSVRVPCTDPEIFFTRYSLKFLVAHFFLKAQLMYV